MGAEASNILRRFIKLSAKLELMPLSYLRVAARTWRPDDLRLLAWEITDLASRTRLSERSIRVIRADDVATPTPPDPAQELRGLARSITRYGGPDAVHRDSTGSDGDAT